MVDSCHAAQKSQVQVNFFTNSLVKK